MIVDVMSLPSGGLTSSDYLIIETADPLDPQISKWSFYNYSNGKFRLVCERIKNGTHHQILPIGLDEDRTCYAAYAPGESLLEIQCTLRNRLQPNHTLLFEKHHDVTSEKPILQVSTFLLRKRII